MIESEQVALVYKLRWDSVSFFLHAEKGTLKCITCLSEARIALWFKSSLV